MMLNKCKVVACKNEKPRRFLVCSSCWNKVPKEMRADVRYGTEKGNHTLRVNPDKTFYGKIMEYVGMIKVPFIVGHGHTAVKLAADKSEV